jgi:tetratricopeptide (TPR) repeat protein
VRPYDNTAGNFDDGAESLQSSQPSAGSHPHHLLGALLADWRMRVALFALTLLAYANSFSSKLVLDAIPLLGEDERIRALTFENLRLIFTTNYWGTSVPDWLYRPVTTLSLLFNYAVLGNGAATTGYHIVNFLLHLGNVWLVLALARRVLGNRWAAFLAAAVWAVHPIGVDAVTNIAGRADLLAAMSVLGGLLLYAHLDNLQGWRLRASVAGLFAIATAGAFSKENAVVLIGLMVLWDLCRAALPGPPRRGYPSAYAAVSASLVLLWAARHLVLSSLPMAEDAYVDNPLRVAGFLAARWTAIKVIAIDLGLLVWPAALSSDHSYADIVPRGLSDPASWMAFAVVAALLIAAIVRYRRDRVMFFAAGFFAIAILPTSNLIVPIGAIMADRFLYLPSVAFAIALVALVSRVLPRRTATILLSAAILLCASRTFVRNFAWHDGLALASADVLAAPESFKTHDALATELFKQDPQRNLDRMIAEEERAWAILEPLPPQLSDQLVPSSLGYAYSVKGDAAGGPLTPAGRAWYEKSLAVLLRAREVARGYEQAFDETQQAAGARVSRRLASPNPYLNLGNTLLALGRFAEAREAFRYAQGLEPDVLAPYNGMVLASQEMGHPEDAAVAAEEEGLLKGFPPNVVQRIAKVYQALPEGTCAVGPAQDSPRLNLRCPIVERDLCRAIGELATANREARRYAEAVRFAGAVASQYGCPANQ